MLLRRDVWDLLLRRDVLDHITSLTQPHCIEVFVSRIEIEWIYVLGIRYCLCFYDWNLERFRQYGIFRVFILSKRERRILVIIYFHTEF